MLNSNAVGIILAAGESSRMGSPKGLLEWRGTTLLEYQMNSLLQGGCDKVVVVTGKYDTEMSPLLKNRPRIIRSYNPKYFEVVQFDYTKVERKYEAQEGPIADWGVEDIPF